MEKKKLHTNFRETARKMYSLKKIRDCKLSVKFFLNNKMRCEMPHFEYCWGMVARAFLWSGYAQTLTLRAAAKIYRKIKYNFFGRKNIIYEK